MFIFLVCLLFLKFVLIYVLIILSVRFFFKIFLFNDNIFVLLCVFDIFVENIFDIIVYFILGILLVVKDIFIFVL